MFVLSFQKTVTYIALPYNFTPALDYTMFVQSLVITIYEFIFLH